MLAAIGRSRPFCSAHIRSRERPSRPYWLRRNGLPAQAGARALARSMIHVDDDELWLLDDITDNVEFANRFSRRRLKRNLRCPEIPAFASVLCPLAIVGKILLALGVFDEDVHGAGFTRFS